MPKALFFADIIISIIIILVKRVFPPAFADCFSLESKWE